MAADHLEHRRHAVRRATRAGEDRSQSLVIQVHAVNDGRDVVVLGRRRQHHAFRPGVEVLHEIGAPIEMPGAFQHQIDPEILPGQLGGVPLRKDAAAIGSDDQRIRLGGHLGLVPTIHGIVIEQIGQLIGSHDIIDGHYLDLRRLQQELERRPADPS